LVSSALVTWATALDRQAEHGGHPGARGEKVAPGNALGLGMFPNGGSVGIRHKNGWLMILIIGFTTTFGRTNQRNQP
jgi:hypothetical protein